MNVDDPTVMREMARMAMEQAATFFAKMARDFAKGMPPDATAEQALLAFANAIESTNAKIYEVGPKQ